MSSASSFACGGDCKVVWGLLDNNVESGFGMLSCNIAVVVTSVGIDDTLMGTGKNVLSPVEVVGRVRTIEALLVVGVVVRREKVVSVTLEVVIVDPVTGLEE